MACILSCIKIQIDNSQLINPNLEERNLKASLGESQQRQLWNLDDNISNQHFTFIKGIESGRSMTQNPPPATGMSSYDTKSASSENPSHCEWLSRARGRRHQEDGALNPAMAQITLTPGQNRPKSITNNMNNSIDEIGQTFNHMRIRNRHRSTSLDRDTRNG